MPTPSSVLLDRLAGAGGPISGSIGSGPCAASPIDFGAMLLSARAGEVSTGLPVTIARDSGVELTDDQLERLAHAADRAQSAGSTRALVLLDGRAIEIDVAVRQVVREHGPGEGVIVRGIDAVVDLDGRLTGPASTSDAAIEVAGPAASMARNRSLLGVLAARAGQDGASGARRADA